MPPAIYILKKCLIKKLDRIVFMAVLRNKAVKSVLKEETLENHDEIKWQLEVSLLASHWTISPIPQYCGPMMLNLTSQLTNHRPARKLQQISF